MGRRVDISAGSRRNHSFAGWTASGVVLDPEEPNFPWASFAMPANDVVVTANWKWDNPFADVREGGWFFDAVRYVHEYGLFEGTAGTAFSPNGHMTRAMLAIVLARLDGAELAGCASGRFIDVPEGIWYSAAVEWLAASGIADGVGGGRFAPIAPVTREQIAVMLWNYAQFKGIPLEPEPVAADFADAGMVSAWAREAVGAIHAAGVITGRPGNLFAPQGIATRAEVATMVMRLAAL